MGSYTIKSGDTLWGIVKRQFNLTSNKDIANKIKEVASKNGITNPNRIFAGKTLDLDLGTGVTLEREGSQEQSIETQMAELTQAQKAAQDRIKSNDIQSYEDLNKLSSSAVSLWNDKELTDEKKNEAYKEYSNFLLNNYYDKNGDGKVTVDEFAEKEQESSLKAMMFQAEQIDKSTRQMLAEDPEMLKLYDKNGDGEIAQDEYENVLAELDISTVAGNTDNTNQTIAFRSANLFAQNLDINGNGFIDAEELAFFNKNADACDGNSDGVISNSGESAMFGAVTGINAGNEEYNRVINKYLAGETLTADEQKILEESQKTIRTAMGKAAGIIPQN